MEEYDISTLINNAIDPQLVNENPDIGIFLEIADRMKKNDFFAWKLGTIPVPTTFRPDFITPSDLRNKTNPFACKVSI